MKEEKNIKKIIILRVVLIICIILWMITVFMFSAQNSTDSSELSQYIVKFFNKTDSNILILEHIIRKIAHFSIYTIGGILIFSFFSTFDFKMKNKIMNTVMIGFLYAGSDEFHQKFVEGRACRFTDVIIDTTGIIFGILIYLIFIKIYSNLKSKKKIY